MILILQGRIFTAEIDEGDMWYTLTLTNLEVRKIVKGWYEQGGAKHVQFF